MLLSTEYGKAMEELHRCNTSFTVSSSLIKSRSEIHRVPLKKKEQNNPMASLTSRIAFRIVLITLLLLALFYMGRPLYWKISATIHDIRHNKQTVREGLSQIVIEAQKSVGWFRDESDSGVRTKNRKLLRNKVYGRVIG